MSFTLKSSNIVSESFSISFTLQSSDIPSKMINQDIMFTIMEHCTIDDLLFGIGRSSRELHRFARIILSRKKCLCIKDDKRIAFETNNIVFHSAKKQDEIGIHFDEKNPHIPISNNSFNVYSRIARKKLRNYFPNVTKLVIGRGRFSLIRGLVRVFPDLVDLRIFDICRDMSEIVKSLPKLLHFTHMSLLYSLGHYSKRIPDHLKRLESYGFCSMDVKFNSQMFESYKFVHFQYVHLFFHKLPDYIRRKLAKKIESFTFRIDSCNPIDAARYEEFVNLQSIALVLLVNRTNNNSRILKVLKMLSQLKKLRRFYFNISNNINNKFFNFLTEDVPVLKNITELIVDCAHGNVNKVMIKRVFPSANITYRNKSSS